MLRFASFFGSRDVLDFTIRSQLHDDLRVLGRRRLHGESRLTCPRAHQVGPADIDRTRGTAPRVGTCPVTFLYPILAVIFGSTMKFYNFMQNNV